MGRSINWSSLQCYFPDDPQLRFWFPIWVVRHVLANQITGALFLPWCQSKSQGNHLAIRFIAYGHSSLRISIYERRSIILKFVQLISWSLVLEAATYGFVCYTAGSTSIWPWYECFIDWEVLLIEGAIYRTSWLHDRWPIHLVDAPPLFCTCNRRQDMLPQR